MTRLLAFFVRALAASTLVAVPAGAGQQSAALDAVDKYLAECHERSENATPGFAVVLVDHDRVAYLKAFGVDSIFGRRPFSVDSVCPVGSLAQSFTALAVMQLAQRGALDLDAPAVKYLPWFRTGDRERSDRITVRMLLNQTSGLPSRDEWSFDEGSEEDAMEQALRMLRARKMSREPGQAYESSNEGYTLAGLIIHRVTGMTYCDYLQSAIFDPLKMKRSAADEEGLDRLHSLTGHVSGIDQAIPAGFAYAPATIPSGSTLACSAGDLGQYLKAMVNHGRVGDVQVIAPAALDEMMTPSIDFPCPIRYDDGGDRSTWHSGLGWRIAQIDGRRLVLEQGDTGLAGSIVLIDPARALAVGIVRNSSEVDPHRFPTLITMANNVLHLAGGESLTNFGVPRGPDPTLNNFRPSRGFLEKCVGSYLSETGTGRFDLALHPDGDGLFAKAAGGAGGGEALVDFRDESLFEFRNVRGTRHGFLRKLPDGSVAGFQLGAEKFRRMRKSVSDGYREVRAKDMRSLVIPVDWEVDWQGPGFAASKPGDRRTVIEGGILYDCPHPMETLAEALHETGTVVENGPIINSAIGGMGWHQQGSTVKRGDEKWQRLIAYIQFEDRLVFITLRTPFGELTKEEQRILLPLMSAWGNDRFFAPVWSAVDVVPETPRSAN
ncbi:MAG TPA: serine hydrolase domain-containing protein [Planctomycetaceae bacterium]|nr:serine hydrolase domain-containing protein [Planctomycetaceae bacterium]